MAARFFKPPTKGGDGVSKDTRHSLREARSLTPSISRASTGKSNWTPRLESSDSIRTKTAPLKQTATTLDMTTPTTFTPPRRKTNRRKTDPSLSDEIRARKHSAELHTSSLVSRACDAFFKRRGMAPSNFNFYDGPIKAVSRSQEGAQDITSDAAGTCSGTNKERDQKHARGRDGVNLSEMGPPQGVS